MDGILHYFFKEERVRKRLSLNNVSLISLVDSSKTRMFEENELDLEENQIIRLFKSIGIDYCKYIEEYNFFNEKLKNIIGKIIYHDQSYKVDFKLLEKDIFKHQDNAAYSNFLVLQILVKHRDDNILHNKKEIENFFCYLTKDFQQVYYLGCGQIEEIKNHFDEALEYYYDALDLQTDNHLAAVSMENISRIYLHNLQLSKALKNIVLAKNLYENHNNKHGEMISKLNEGIIYCEMRDFRASIKCLEECLNETKSSKYSDIHQLALNNIIMAYMLKKDYPGMLAYCELLFKANSKIPHTFFYKAWALYKTNKFDSVRSIIQDARNKISDDMSNIALINMVEVLMSNTKEVENILIKTLDVMKKFKTRIMVCFIIDIITDYYVSSNEFQKACDYFIQKRHLLEN